MNSISIIIGKELKRVFGDRKLIFSLFILPAIVVIAIYGLMGKLIGGMETKINSHISIITVVDAPEGFKATADAMGFGEVADVNYVDNAYYESNRATLEDDVLNANADMIVVFDENFDELFAAYKTNGDTIPNITVRFNSTEEYSQAAYNKLSMVLATFKDNLLASRLGNLEMLTAFNQTDDIIAKEERMNTEFMSMMLPYFIVMLLFAGAMSIGLDSFAGEKERGTLASMLLTPVNRNAIVFGKLVSMGIISGVSSLVYAIAMLVATPLMNSSTSEVGVKGFGSLSFSAIQIVELIAIMLVLVYLYVSLIGFLATLSKDMKMASTFVSPLYIVIIVLGMLSMFTLGGETPTGLYFVPVYGSAMAIKDICASALTVTNFLATLAGSAVLAVILTLLTAKVFNNEKYMFNA